MRTLIICTALLACLAPTDVFAQEASTDGADADEREETPAEAESRERTEAIQEGWSQFFAPPEAHLWEFSAAAGSMLWESAYGGTEPEWYLRAQGRRSFYDFLAASLTVDFTRQAPSAGPLEFSNRRVGVLGGGGVHHWFGRWLLGAGVEAGAIWHTREIRDSTGLVDQSTRFEPAGGFNLRAGVSLFGVASLSVEGGMRWRPDRRDSLVLFNVGWLTGWK